MNWRPNSGVLITERGHLCIGQQGQVQEEEGDPASEIYLKLASSPAAFILYQSSDSSEKPLILWKDLPSSP